MIAIFTVGVSASGKSSWAEEFVAAKLVEDESWIIICRDDVRKQIIIEKTKGAVTELRWDLWKWKDESKVTTRVNQKLQQAIDDDCDGIIIADTNLNYQRLNEFKSRLNDLGIVNIEIKEFPIEFEEAVRRDTARKNGVGYSVIADQMVKWRRYQLDKTGSAPWKPDNKLPAAIMVDLDGTLAHHSGKRGIFEWSKVGVDDCDVMVAETIHGLSMRGFAIIIMSGRDGSCRPETVQWLFDHDIPVTHLYMRAAGDMRKDSIVKKELFWEHVAPNFNVMGVFDDRPQVVRAWQEIGLKTFALGNQLIEF